MLLRAPILPLDLADALWNLALRGRSEAPASWRLIRAAVRVGGDTIAPRSWQEFSKRLAGPILQFADAEERVPWQYATAHLFATDPGRAWAAWEEAVRATALSAAVEARGTLDAAGVERLKHLVSFLRDVSHRHRRQVAPEARAQLLGTLLCLEGPDPLLRGALLDLVDAAPLPVGTWERLLREYLAPGLKGPAQYTRGEMLRALGRAIPTTPELLPLVTGLHDPAAGLTLTETEQLELVWPLLPRADAEGRRAVRGVLDTILAPSVQLLASVEAEEPRAGPGRGRTPHAQLRDDPRRAFTSLAGHQGMHHLLQRLANTCKRRLSPEPIPEDDAYRQQLAEVRALSGDPEGAALLGRILAASGVLADDEDTMYDVALTLVRAGAPALARSVVRLLCGCRTPTTPECGLLLRHVAAFAKQTVPDDVRRAMLQALWQRPDADQVVGRGDLTPLLSSESRDLRVLALRLCGRVGHRPLRAADLSPEPPSPELPPSEEPPGRARPRRLPRPR